MKHPSLWIASTLAFFLVASSCLAQQEPLPEADGSQIGYPTVNAALAALRSKPGATVTNEGGWVIVTEEKPFVIWSFAPESHPAYPAVVKRYLDQDGKAIHMKMAVHCEASKAACDNLVREFIELNNKIRQAVRAQ